MSDFYECVCLLNPNYFLLNSLRLISCFLLFSYHFSLYTHSFLFLLFNTSPLSRHSVRSLVFFSQFPLKQYLDDWYKNITGTWHLPGLSVVSLIRHRLSTSEAPRQARLQRRTRHPVVGWCYWYRGDSRTMNLVCLCESLDVFLQENTESCDL